MDSQTRVVEKAVILVGGYGTRLRPLTFSKPKPLVEFVGRPLLLHQLEALQKCGIREVILALSYMPHGFAQFLEDFSSKLNIKIHCSQEQEALGTAGPLGLVKNIIKNQNDPRPCSFLVLNSDVVCDFRFRELIEHHLSSGAEATIMATKVEDPSRFGVMISEGDRVQSFVEKPKHFIGDIVNAGIYVLNDTVLDNIEPRPMSIEREVFPAIAAGGNLSHWVNPGYWADVGQPVDYLVGTGLQLAFMRETIPKLLSLGDNIKGNVFIDPTATVSPRATIGPNAVIGAGCVVEDGARLSNSVLFAGSQVKKGAMIFDSIIGWKSVIGSWSRVEANSVLGEDCKIKEEVHIIGCKVLPHKEVKESITTPRIIM